MPDDQDIDSGYDDEQPSPEELAQIRLAKPEAVAAVDALLLGQCTDQWRKVAMVVGSSLDEFETRFPDLPYVFMQLRLGELVEQGRLEAQGNVMAMRHSEVRLPARRNG